MTLCARHVFRCFKWVERVGDRITGAAGPYFVGLAVILISLGTLSFCEHTLLERFACLVFSIQSPSCNPA